MCQCTARLSAIQNGQGVAERVSAHWWNLTHIIALPYSLLRLLASTTAILSHRLLSIYQKKI